MHVVICTDQMCSDGERGSRSTPAWHRMQDANIELGYMEGRD